MRLIIKIKHYSENMCKLPTSLPPMMMELLLSQATALKQSSSSLSVKWLQGTLPVYRCLLLFGISLFVRCWLISAPVGHGTWSMLQRNIYFSGYRWNADRVINKQTNKNNVQYRPILFSPQIQLSFNWNKWNNDLELILRRSCSGYMILCNKLFQKSVVQNRLTGSES